MAAEIDIQLFKKLRYANLSGFTRIRIKTTVNEVGTGASNVVNSPIHSVFPGVGEHEIDGDMVNVPYASFYISKVEAVFKKMEPPLPAGSFEMEISGTATTQIPELLVLTAPFGVSIVAFDAETNAAVIGGSYGPLP